MNRMWVHLSLIYAVTILLIAILLVLFLNRVMAGWHAEDLITRLNVTESEAAALRAVNIPDLFQRVFGGAVVTPIIGLLVMAVGGGMTASIVASWYITRPLMQLDAAIRAMGSSQRRSRVFIRGSREVEGLADSFNTTVTELEAAEKRRQNLLADVSHELRTPLTVLQGNLRGMLDDVYTLDKEQIAKLYDHTLQLTHLVDDLHDLAQAEARRLPLQVKAVDLAALVEQAGQLFAPLAGDAGLRLETRIERPIPLIPGDRQRLMQVLQNLIANALKYARNEITITLRSRPDQVFLEVADDGPGIARDDLQHVFNRFYRASDSHTHGTGLGLAIAASIIEAHHGAIRADSVPGEGTAISVLLPSSNHPVL